MRAPLRPAALAALVGCAGAPAHVCPCHEVTVEDPCRRLAGGPPGSSPNADVGRAHALARYFGVGTNPVATDARLADALEAGGTYRPLESCAAPAERRALGPMRVTLEHGVAVLRPGLGESPRIPGEARAVAVDVSLLPETEAARAAVHRALESVLHERVMLPSVAYRTCNGQPDEVAGQQLRGRPIDQYRCVRTEDRAVIEGHGRALPLAVVVAPRMTPLAAWTAAMLRGAADAFIVGSDVPLPLAESRWVGIGDGGLAIRVSHVPSLPDVLAADAPDLAHVDWAGPRRRPPARNARAAIRDLERVSAEDLAKASTRQGDYRAALLVAFAATKTLFPYRDEPTTTTDRIATDLDERLEEAMTHLGADRASARRALQRYSHALRDGHGWVFDDDRSAPYWPGRVRIVATEGQGFAVTHSTTPLVRPGDVVLEVGGVETRAWLTEQEGFTSGSPAHALSILGARITSQEALRIRTPAGEEKTVRIGPPEVEVPAMRGADPHVPGVVYVDLSRVASTDDVSRIQRELLGARGLVLDMRGYPTRPAWAVLAAVAPADARGPDMAELVVTPFSRERGPSQPPQTLRAWVAAGSAAGPRYEGPAVMLIGPDTQSQAEHLVTFFRSRNRGKLIGLPTSGANGTITGVRLPGGFGLTFTGMSVRHPDGRPFHSIGHIPDIVVQPTVDDLSRGRDAALERALRELAP